MSTIPAAVKRILPFAVLVLLFLGSSASAVYLYQRVRILQADPQRQAQEEADALVAKVGTLMILPDERPTVATVNDKEKLKDQPFFAQAEVGDKVLIFAAAKKAILYSPSRQRIVEAGPMTVNAQPEAAPVSATAPAVPAPATNAAAK